MKKKTKKTNSWGGKRKNQTGRPRRSDAQLLLEGRPRAEKKSVKAKTPGALKIPTFKKESERIFYFFKTYLKHTMGQWAGQPFEPLPWQKEFIRNVFDTKKKNGLRQYRKALLSVSRKNGKTCLSGGLLLYWLIVKSEQNKNLRIYSAATVKEQAALIFDAASQMVSESKELSKRIRIIPRYKRLVNHRTGGRYEALSGDIRGTYGFFNAELIIFDEIWEQKDISFISSLQKSQINLKEPLFLMLTTTGNNQESPLYDEYSYAKQIEKGIFEDDSFYFKIYELEEGDDWTLEANWYKANPSLKAGLLDIEELRAQCQRAIRIPREQNEWKQFHCNLWVSAASAWLNVGDWKKCFDLNLKIEDFKGQPCYMGIDLSQTRDLTAVVLLFPKGDEYSMFPFFWLPESNIQDKAKAERVTYDLWAKDGFLNLTPGNVIDYEVVEVKILELASLYDVKMIGIDPYNALQVRLKLEGEGLNVTDVRQGFISMNAPIKELERLILSGKIHHNGNPIYSWMLDNCTLIRDSTGNFKIDKRRASLKVDGVSATLDALAIILNQEVEMESIYVKEEMVVLGVRGEDDGGIPLPTREQETPRHAWAFRFGVSEEEIMQMHPDKFNEDGTFKKGALK